MQVRAVACNNALKRSNLTVFFGHYIDTKQSYNSSITTETSKVRNNDGKSPVV